MPAARLCSICFKPPITGALIASFLGGEWRPGEMMCLPQDTPLVCDGTYSARPWAEGFTK